MSHVFEMDVLLMLKTASSHGDKAALGIYSVSTNPLLFYPL